MWVLGRTCPVFGLTLPCRAPTGLGSRRSTIDLSVLQFQHVPENPTHYPNRLLIEGYSLCPKSYTVTISFRAVRSKHMATPKRRFWPPLPITSPRCTT